MTSFARPNDINSYARPESFEQARLKANGYGGEMAGAQRATATPARVALTSIADVTAEPVNWIWPGRLARKKITLVSGDPGLGKSQIATDIAARLSRGDHWPDQGHAPIGSTVILSAEDGLGDTIRPRLEASEADLRRVHALTAVTEGDGKRRTFCLQSDLAQLGEAIASIGDVALVQIDPITSYMGKIDSHRTTDVRSVLEPLSDFAEQHNVAVLAVSHPPKATQAKAMHAVTGSLAYVAAARMVFIVTEDPHDEGRRLLLPVKNNLAAKSIGLGYRLAQRIVGDNIVASHVIWCSSPVIIDANQALAANAENARDSGAMTEAQDFLREALASGAKPASDLEREAEAAGIAEKTLKRARKALGVRSSKDSFSSGWVVSLPQGKPH